LKVLYATNGMEVAQNAGTLISRLGNRASVELLVLCVGNFEFVLAAEPFLLGTEPTRRKQPAEVLAQAEDDFREAGFRVQTRYETGIPADETLRVIESEECELSVLGAGRQSWLGSLLLGSTSTSVLHSSPTSVLLVHEVSPEKRDLRVLIGVDGSESADHAVGAFCNFADPARCAVTVLSVAELPRSPFLNPPHPKEGGLPEPTEESAQRLSESTAHALHSRGFTAGAEVSVGSPLVELLKHADKRDIDLIVVGSRGLGSFKGGVFGSVSDQITRLAKAVLVGHKYH
jgi:nucleotide-binding universal stress UspA family protein